VGPTTMGRWLIAGSDWMLGQDLVPALHAGLCAPGVTAFERDSLGCHRSGLPPVLRQWPVMTFQHRTGQAIEL